MKSIWYFYIKDEQMVIFPKSKINLGLRITEKRTDGYHNIESFFYPVNLCDALEIVRSSSSGEDQFNSSGINTGETSENNLVMKAVKVMRENFSFPALKIHLHKAIPIGAGLGGGSSDAAGIITGINRLFNMGVPLRILKEIALNIGSDCPFFIDNAPAIAMGRGEILTHADEVLKAYYIVLINPQINVSTREAYSNCHPEIPKTNLTNIIGKPVSEWKDVLINDFEDYAFRRYPVIREIKENLYNAGAVYSSMSGSGSTVYGLFKTNPYIPEKYKDFVIYSGYL